MFRFISICRINNPFVYNSRSAILAEPNHLSSKHLKNNLYDLPDLVTNGEVVLTLANKHPVNCLFTGVGGNNLEELAHL